MFMTIKKPDAEIDKMITEFFANGGKITYCIKGARSNDGMFDTAQFPTKEQRAKNKKKFGGRKKKVI